MRLPPGRARLAMKPEPTGSETLTNTIGTLRVSRCNVAVTGRVREDHTGLHGKSAPSQAYDADRR